MARTTITNRLLLQHMQGMKSEILTRFDGLETRVDTLEKKVDDGFENVRRKFESVDRQFEVARQHREALQEDLDASIRMLGKHDKKLARL